MFNNSVDISNIIVSEERKILDRFHKQLNLLKESPENLPTLLNVESGILDLEASVENIDFPEFRQIISKTSDFIQKIILKEIEVNSSTLETLEEIHQILFRLTHHQLGESIDVSEAQNRALALLETAAENSIYDEENFLDDIIHFIQLFWFTLNDYQSSQNVRCLDRLNQASYKLSEITIKENQPDIQQFAHLFSQVCDIIITNQYYFEDSIVTFLQRLIHSIKNYRDQADVDVDILLKDLQDRWQQILDQLKPSSDNDEVSSMDNFELDGFQEDSWDTPQTESAPEAEDQLVNTGAFLSRSLDNVKNFTDDLNSYAEDPFDVDLLDSAYSNISSLRQDADRSSFISISKLARMMQKVMGNIRSGKIEFNPDLMDLLHDSAEALISLLGTIAGEDVDEDAILLAIKERYKQILPDFDIEVEEIPEFEPAIEEPEEEEVAQTQDQFLQKSLGLVKNFTGALAEYEQNPFDITLLDKIYDSLSQLSKVSSNFGAKYVSAISTSLAEVVDDIRIGKTALEDTIIDLFHESAEAMTNLLATLAGEKSDKRKIYESIQQKFNYLGYDLEKVEVPEEEVPAAPPEPPQPRPTPKEKIAEPTREQLDNFLAECLDRIKNFTETITTYEEEPTELELLEDAHEMIAGLKTSAQRLGLNYIAEVSNLMATLVQHVHSGSLELDEEVMDVLRDGAETLTTLLAPVMGEEIDADLILKAIRERFNPILERAGIPPIPPKPEEVPPVTETPEATPSFEVSFDEEVPETIPEPMETEGEEEAGFELSFDEESEEAEQPIPEETEPAETGFELSFEEEPSEEPEAPTEPAAEGFELEFGEEPTPPSTQEEIMSSEEKKKREKKEEPEEIFLEEPFVPEETEETAEEEELVLDEDFFESEAEEEKVEEPVEEEFFETEAFETPQSETEMEEAEEPEEFFEAEGFETEEAEEPTELELEGGFFEPEEEAPEDMETEMFEAEAFEPEAEEEVELETAEEPVVEEAEPEELFEAEAFEAPEEPEELEMEEAPEEMETEMFEAEAFEPEAEEEIELETAEEPVVEEAEPEELFEAEAFEAPEEPEELEMEEAPEEMETEMFEAEAFEPEAEEEIELETAEEPEIPKTAEEEFFERELELAEEKPSEAEEGAPKPIEIPELNKDILEFFLVEATEHIQNLTDNLSMLKADMENLEYVEKIRRTCHTLAGSASMLEIKNIGKIANKMKELNRKIYEEEIPLTDNMLELNEYAVQSLKTLLNGLQGQPIYEKKVVRETSEKLESAITRGEGIEEEFMAEVPEVEEVAEAPAEEEMFEEETLFAPEEAEELPEMELEEEEPEAIFEEEFGGEETVEEIPDTGIIDEEMEAPEEVFEEAEELPETEIIEEEFVEELPEEEEITSEDIFREESEAMVLEEVPEEEADLEEEIEDLEQGEILTEEPEEIEFEEEAELEEFEEEPEKIFAEEETKEMRIEEELTEKWVEPEEEEEITEEFPEVEKLEHEKELEELELEEEEIEEVSEAEVPEIEEETPEKESEKLGEIEEEEEIPEELPEPEELEMEKEFEEEISELEEEVGEEPEEFPITEEMEFEEEPEEIEDVEKFLEEEYEEIEEEEIPEELPKPEELETEAEEVPDVELEYYEGEIPEEEVEEEEEEEVEEELPEADLEYYESEIEISEAELPEEELPEAEEKAEDIAEAELEYYEEGFDEEETEELEEKVEEIAEELEYYEGEIKEEAEEKVSELEEEIEEEMPEAEEIEEEKEEMPELEEDVEEAELEEIEEEEEIPEAEEMEEEELEAEIEEEIPEPEIEVEEEEEEICIEKEEYYKAIEFSDSLIDLASALVIGKTQVNKQLDYLHSLIDSLSETREKLLEDLLELKNELSIPVETEKTEPLIPESGAYLMEDFSTMEYDNLSGFYHLEGDLQNSISTIEELTKRLNNVSERMSEGIANMNNTSKRLIIEIVKSRVIPFSSLFDVIERKLNHLSQKKNQEVNITFDGGDILIDTNVREQLEYFLSKLLRYALDDIEPASDREVLGKSEEGTIEFSAREDTGQVIIEMKSDGAGKSYHSEVLQSDIAQLNGILNVKSDPGSGVKFITRFPQKRTVFSAVFFRAEDDVFALPAAKVKETNHINIKDIAHAEGEEYIKLHGDEIPIVRMSKLFKLDEEEKENYVVLVWKHQPDKTVGLLADTILGYNDILLEKLFYNKESGTVYAYPLWDNTIRIILGLEKSS